MVIVLLLFLFATVTDRLDPAVRNWLRVTLFVENAISFRTIVGLPVVSHLKFESVDGQHPPSCLEKIVNPESIPEIACDIKNISLAGRQLMRYEWVH